jgi:transketolase
MEINELKEISKILRKDVLEMTTNAGSGHPTSCLSCAEIVSNLFFNEMKYDISNPYNPDNDELIISKGHVAPILYSALFRAGCIRENLNSLRDINSNLEGHPMPRSLDWIKVATGSLGQGLSIGLGMALAGKMQKRKFRTFVLLGDSEMAEGSNYEAMQLASYYKLNNLIAIVDVNRLGQRGETMVGHDINQYKERFESFGWEVINVDGNDIKSVIGGFRILSRNKPSVILAKTIKGRGVSFLEDKEGWHGKTLNEKELEEALKEIGESKMPKIKIEKPQKIKFNFSKKRIFKMNNYEKGSEVATREAYGNALSVMAENDKRVIVLDGEVSNSTKSDKVKNSNKEQFLEMFIAEQNMIGVALGLSIKGYNVYSSSFAAFLSRAHDQIRMAALSEVNFSICGSHAGVSIGEDGASQMGIEDIAMFRSLPNSYVFYPSDAVSAEKLIELSSEIKGLKYIRTTRNKTKVLYGNNEKFEIGGFKVIKNSNKSKVVLVGAGITVHECLKAAEKIDEISVIDLYCIKPFNDKKFIEFVKNNGRKLLIVEDHRPEGGIGEMLCSSIVNSGEKIKMKHLAVKKIPHSGKTEEVMEDCGIGWKNILSELKKW